MNVGFTPEAILGVVYGCLDAEGRSKWENAPDMYPEQLHTESTIRGDNINVSGDFPWYSPKTGGLDLFCAILFETSHND